MIRKLAHSVCLGWLDSLYSKSDAAYSVRPTTLSELSLPYVASIIHSEHLMGLNTILSEDPVEKDEGKRGPRLRMLELRQTKRVPIMPSGRYRVA